MSNEEIRRLLDKYGIKHGPVVDSTRGLYERKLSEAMSRGKPAKPASDKTFYREEEEEVTYIYRSPVRGPETTDSGAYMRSRPHWSKHGEDTPVKTVSSLWTLSHNGIRKLLDEYRIKHGPVVDSTRGLYERKLSEIMSKVKVGKLRSGRTFCREKEEEVTYIYRSPLRGEEAGDSGAYMRSRPHQLERPFEQGSSNFSYSRTTPEYRANHLANQSYTYETPSTFKNLDYTSAPVKSAQETKTPPRSSRLIPLWVQIAFFLAVAVFFYVVFASMETNESFQGIE